MANNRSRMRTEKRVSGKELVEEILEGSQWWKKKWKFQVHHRAASTSDHCILLLRDLPSSCQPSTQSKLFRFEAMWLQDKSFAEVVDRAWEKGINSTSENIFLKCLEECHSSLTI
nr:hypothetical protein CFP56_13669 [Quercus suber]